jgi:hypothetical protein
MMTFEYYLVIGSFLIGYLASLPFGAMYGVLLTIASYVAGFVIFLIYISRPEIDQPEGVGLGIALMLPLWALASGAGLLMGESNRWWAKKFGKKMP